MRRLLAPLALSLVVVAAQTAQRSATYVPMRSHVAIDGYGEASWVPFHVWSPRIDNSNSTAMNGEVPLVLFSVGWGASCVEHFGATLERMAADLSAVVCCPEDRAALAACEKELRYWWALTEATTGLRLSRTNIAVAGHSMGGVQALRHAAATFPPPKVAVALNPWLLGGVTLDDAPPPLDAVESPIARHRRSARCHS